MIRVGIIGHGYWGANLARNFAEAPGCRLAAVSDRRQERLALVRDRYPTVEVTTDCKALLADPRIDAVVVATPVSSHFELGLQALESGKHLLLEKPVAATSHQAARLIEVAGRSNLVLMVDHTFVYTGAVRKIRELVANRHLGDIYYYDSVRVNLGLFQHDVDVVWDLAVHDLSIMDYVLPSRPTTVSATGISHVPNGLANIAYLTLFFDDGSIGHVHVSWLAPVKVRCTLIGGNQKMIVYDDLEPSEKVKIYDKGITISDSADSIYQMRIGYRTGDMWAPQLDLTEALATGARHFLDCIETGSRPITSGETGLWLVQVLEAAARSMASQGRLVDLVTGAFTA